MVFSLSSNCSARGVDAATLLAVVVFPPPPAFSSGVDRERESG